MKSFPSFSLSRLLQTVFAPKPGQRIAVLIDLPEPRRVAKCAFLQDSDLPMQRLAYDVFVKGLQDGVLEELKLTGGELFAYEVTGGSNLDLPATAFDVRGNELAFAEQIFPHYNILLCISTYSATAPLTAAAKKYGFRGATLHGLNETILNTGLSVDYNEVSLNAEKLRLALTRADHFEIDFNVQGQSYTLKLICSRQEAQKSHGLARGEKPDVVNLPAGEVYYVPTGAEGLFPLRYEDGTIGLMEVANGNVRHATLLRGNPETISAHNYKLKADPATGVLGELGFGTQELPPAGRDIQDEKILGTLHVATGRSDHLGGGTTPDKFKDAKHATHDDILFSPTKTPEITVTEARMNRDGKTTVVLREYAPAEYLRRALETQ